MYYGANTYIGRGHGAGKNYGAFFYRRGFTGASTLIEPGADPVIIQHSTEALNVRLPRKAQFQLLSSAAAQLKDFFVKKDRDLFVLITEVTGTNDDQAQVHFVGYVSQFDCSEDYAPVPYPISLTATDGLGSLADFSYLQYPSGLPVPGRVTVAAYITNCLKWMGYELPIWFSMHLAEEANWGAVNVFGIAQHPGLGFDAFQVNKVDANEWLADDGTYKSCAEVLDTFCKTFRLLILQEKGCWKFLCVDELPGLVADFNAPRLRYWNTYQPDGTYAQVIENPFVVINDENDGEMVPVMGAKTSIEPPKPRIKTTYKYGGFNSDLKNGGFIGNPGEVPQNWTRRLDANVPGSGVIFGTGTADDPYWLRIIGLKNGDPKKAYQTDQRYYNVVYQSLVIDIKPEAQRKINVSGTFRNIKTKGAAMEVVAVLGHKNNNGDFVEMPNSGNVTSDLVGNSFALQSSGEWKSKKKGDTVNYLHFDSIQKDDLGPLNGKDMYVSKPTSGESFSVASQAIPIYPFPGQNPVLPTAVKVTLTLWPGPDFDARDHSNAYTLYRNVRITLEDAAFVDIDSEEIITEVSGLTTLDRKKTEDVDLTLADQTTAWGVPPKPLRPGALLRVDGVTATRRWMMANGGHVDKIQNQVARNSLIFSSVPRTIYDGSLGGEPGPLAVYVATELQGKNLFAFSYKWSMKNRTVDVRARELPNDLDRLMEVVVAKAQYLDKDGSSHDFLDSASAPAGDYVTPSVPSIRKSDPLSALQDKVAQLSYVPIDAAFTPVGVVPPPLYSPTNPVSDPQFETIN